MFCYKNRRIKQNHLIKSIMLVSKVNRKAGPAETMTSLRTVPVLHNMYCWTTIYIDLRSQRKLHSCWWYCTSIPEMQHELLSCVYRVRSLKSTARFQVGNIFNLSTSPFFVSLTRILWTENENEGDTKLNRWLDLRISVVVGHFYLFTIIDSFF